MNNIAKILVSLVIFGLVSLVSAAQPPGVTTAPYSMTYTAKLKDNAGNPIVTAHTVRFSIWQSSDFSAGDIDGSGNINLLAPNYMGWQESYNVTPNQDGIFTVQLGSQNVLPNFNSDWEKFLQVEVKSAANANTAFEILDPTGNMSDSQDRKPLTSSPYT
ncbi:hypothetical protein GF376_03000, partial [Candidatus Peregrinibacteria bacterium]|nr:hypothetical protein [Candidatus Peregrinibacteria bacterium]